MEKRSGHPSASLGVAHHEVEGASPGKARGEARACGAPLRSGLGLRPKPERFARSCSASLGAKPQEQNLLWSFSEYDAMVYSTLFTKDQRDDVMQCRLDGVMYVDSYGKAIPLRGG